MWTQRATSQILLLRMVVCFGWIICSFCVLYFSHGVELVDHNLVVGLGVYGSPPLEAERSSIGPPLHPRGKIPMIEDNGLSSPLNGATVHTRCGLCAEFVKLETMAL